jgi:transcription-repair coupling factor (superfamily II helicase)
MMTLPAALISSLKTGTPPAHSEAPLAAHGYVLIQAAAMAGKPIVHVLPQDKDVEAMAALCRFLAPELEILTLPAWDTLPYDRVSPSHAITAARLNTLSRLATRGVVPLPLGERLGEGAASMAPKS